MTANEMLLVLNQKLDKIDAKLSAINERLDSIEEDAEITRVGVNSLLEWADLAGRTINVRLVE